MPLSKINRPGLNTGIDDNSDATAITIDSSENVTFAGNVDTADVRNTGDLSLTAFSSNTSMNSGLSAKILLDNAGTGYGQITMTTGGGGAGTFNGLNIDPNGRVTKPSQPSFLARGLAGQPGVGGVFVFNGTDYNRGNCYSTSNGRFTAPVNGFYMFTCHVMGDSTNNRLMLRLFKNGTHMSQGSSSSNGSQYQDSRIAFMMYMAAGDYAEVINQGNKNRYDNGPTHNHFAGHLLG